MRLACLALLSALPACGGGDDDVPPGTRELIVIESCGGLAAPVTSATVDGDLLTYTTEYRDCTNEVWACWDGSFQESFPVQAPISVRHRDEGDCDTLQTVTLTVDLSPMIDAYAEAYGRLDPITLRVGDIRVTWQP